MTKKKNNKVIQALKEMMIIAQVPPELALPPRGDLDLGSEAPIEETAPEEAAAITPPHINEARSAQVKECVERLRQALAGAIDSIYQMKLTEPQLAELTEKVLVNLSDEISAVTLERVKDIANELLVKK